MAGQVHATGNFAELLWPGIAHIWGTDYKDYPALYSQFFTVESSDQNFEKEQQITGFPIAGIKEEGNEGYFSQMYQGYQKEYRHYTYSIGAVVTREMAEDDQYNVIKQIPKFLARSMREVEEVIAHNVINSGFTAPTSGGTPTADGVSFFNTAHPLVGGGTLSNTLATTADLTQTSLEQALTNIMDFTDDQGLKKMFTAKTLVVPTASNFIARKILETQYAVGSADNDKNIIASMPLKLVVSPYVTDNDSWYLVTDAPQGLKFKVRREAELDRDNDFETQNLKLLETKRMSCGVTDSARAVFGVAGA